MRRDRRAIDGVLLLDKPAGITSNAALQRAKRALNAAKAGHTGTLDPLASGLLPICFGEATKLAQFLLDAKKRYVAIVRFGVETTTQDAEGEIVATRPVSFGVAELQATLSRFTGRILQTPPSHSALKHQGRKLYEYARAGEVVERAPRPVDVLALTLVDWRPPDATLAIECGKGMYVRALAADLGAALHCGAHLASLTRTATGGFDVRDAVALDVLEAEEATLRERRLLPPDTLVRALPSLGLDPEGARRFAQGMAVPAAGLADGDCAVYAGDALVGIATIAAGTAQPRRLVRAPAGIASARSEVSADAAIP
jgi:tRNA pseudouridine55 synthase